MGEGLLNEEILQDLYCDPSRGTNKGARILRNVGECAPFFSREEKVLCVGCGDGLELQAWELLGYKVIGLDISKAKAVVAKAHGCTIWRSEAHNLIDISMGVHDFANIYCAHTLEHLRQPQRMVAAFARLAVRTIAIIVPLEPKGTKNPSHHMAVRRIGDIQILGWRVVKAEERYNHEPEGVIIFAKQEP